MYFIYSAGLALALLLTLPYWLIQAMLKGKYRAGLKERLGIVSPRLRVTQPEENCIWVHAVSVGEVLAVSGVIQALQSRFGEKGWRVVISTTTMTGQKLAREKFGEENAFYFPLDFEFALRPYFRLLRPKLVILAETEFWPNFLQTAHSSTARVAVVNARISDRSLPRYKLFRTILGRILRNVDIFLAQSEEDKNRLIAVGADAARVQVSGNLKFDVTAPKESDLVRQLRDAIPANAPVIVCGSTVEGEEAMLLTAFKRVLAESSQAVMVLAPRHPERFPLVKSMLSESGLSFWLRSGWNGGPIRRGVLLLDTIGDLASTYALGTGAFVGGSLVARGGHNILEPAQFAKPIFVGPYTENFRDIMNIFLRGDAVHVVDPQALGTELAMMLDPKWQAMGERALQVFRSQSGATQRTVDALEVLMWMPSTIKARYQQAQQ